MSGEKILIVDDSKTIRKILATSLTKVGYQVEFAENGQEGLEVFAQTNPDLVLLDVDMPIMDGFSMLEKLKEDSSFTTPVLFLTAKTSGEEAARGLVLGAQDYLRKPCTEVELMARVSGVLALRQRDFLWREKVSTLGDLTSTDELTGLGNRRKFELRVKELGKIVGYRVGVIMADVDFFKKVNDTFGHAVGDLVLVEISKRMLNTLDKRTTLVRWGGEEFLILVPLRDGNTVNIVAERLRLCVCDKSIIIDEKDGEYNTLDVSVSLGCVEGTIESIDQLVKDADKALYIAKEKGRNRVEHITDRI